MENPYLQQINLSLARLLGLLNRNPIGKTKGSFSRNYWHYKTSDFAPAIHQMGMSILAKAYFLPNSIIFQNPKVLDWIEASIDFTERIQKSDGSFDEWYVNERGWAGPTGYLLNSFCSTYELLHQQLKPHTQKKLLEIIIKSSTHLIHSTEKHILTNHIAMAYLPLVQAANILKSPKLEITIKKLEQDILGHFHEKEGWCLEYDGADLAYQTATVSFLSKAHAINQSPFIKSIAEKSLQFISHFFYPDGSFGGHIGSRHTNAPFYFAFEYWKEELGLAAKLCQSSYQSLSSGFHLPLTSMDDHYLIYRLDEFLDAARAFNEKKINPNLPLLPYEKEPFEQYFEQAKIYVKKTTNLYFVCNLGKGMASKCFSLEQKKMILNESGVAINLGKNSYISAWQLEGEVRTLGNMFKINGELVRFSEKVFSPFTFLAFRLFTLIFGFNAKISLTLKNLIRKFLIISAKKGPVSFSRELYIHQNSIVIKSKFHSTKQIDSVYYGGEYFARYVPQSRYFTQDQLKLSCLTKDINKYEFDYTITIKENEQCVEYLLS